MNREQFDQWFDRHSAMFPRVAETFTKLGNQEQTRNVRNAWRDALAWTKLEEANAASDAMLSGEMKRPYFEDTVAAVCGYVRQARGDRRDRTPRFLDGQQTFACLHCEDYGFVVIWSDRCVHAAKAGEPWRPTFGGGTSVACCCVAGERKTRGIAPRNPQGERRFRPGADVLFVSTHGTQPAASDPEDWRHFCEQVAAARPAGFHEEFAAFSN